MNPKKDKKRKKIYFGVPLRLLQSLVENIGKHPSIHTAIVLKVVLLSEALPIISAVADTAVPK